MAWTFDEIKKKFDEDCNNPGVIEPGLWGAALHILEDACGSVDNRYQFQKLLTGCVHSRDLSDGQRWGLLMFVLPMKSELTKKWISRRGDEFEHDVQNVLAKAVDQPGQEKMF